MHTNTEKTIVDAGLTKGKKYFQNFHTDQPKPWFHNVKLSREYIVTISRCRTNHYHLAASLARLSIIDSPKCPCEMYDQDLNHVVWQCSLFDRHRIKLLQDLAKCKQQLPLNIDALLHEPNIAALSCIIAFFKKCNLNV